MNEDQLTRLRNKIKRSQERLEGTSQIFFRQTLQRFWRFLQADPIIAPILDELKRNEKAANRYGIIRQHVKEPNMRPAVRDDFESATIDEHAALLFHLMGYAVEHVNNLSLLTEGLFGSNATYQLQDHVGFKTEVLTPFCDYLDERLDEQQALAGLLVRYKKRCEWFNRAELLKLAEDEEASKGNDKKRAEVEKVLKEDLYRYLHDQGLAFTIEPYSHQGEIDLILDQTAGDRKYLEGKVFDNKTRNAKYIVKGFGQLLHYLRQYNAPDGYLLVYKTCEKGLVIDGAELLGQIPFVRCEGKVIFVLVVDLCEYDKPVSQRSQERVSISASELCKADPG